jgi:hypothetical protein
VRVERYSVARRHKALRHCADRLPHDPAEQDSRAWDNISGAATIGGIERPVRATSRYWASAIDAPTIAQSNHARVSAAAQALAFWIARYL